MGVPYTVETTVLNKKASNFLRVKTEIPERTSVVSVERPTGRKTRVATRTEISHFTCEMVAFNMDETAVGLLSRSKRRWAFASLEEKCGFLESW